VTNFFTLYGGEIEVFIQSNTRFDFKQALEKLEKVIPGYFLLQGIDVIYVGDFADLEDRNLNAAYADGAIYVLPNQSSEQDFLDDIVHEVAHSLEERFTGFIYGDGKIQQEYEEKYLKLIDLMAKQAQIGIPEKFLKSVPFEYDPEWDEFLYQTVGYDTLHLLTPGLFASPYGATSLREYWANAFEHFFLTNAAASAIISPQAHNKIKELDDRAKAT
tara:strand:+ start:413 stop:1063 length:651 start_codon:yes stop_codon:yes gene_type:complete